MQLVAGCGGNPSTWEMETEGQPSDYEVSLGYLRPCIIPEHNIRKLQTKTIVMNKCVYMSFRMFICGIHLLLSFKTNFRIEIIEKIFKRFILCFICVCICVLLCVYMHMCVDVHSQKRLLDSLELEL